MYVESARKKRIKDDIIKVLGEADDLPKGGKYTACCTNEEMAQLMGSIAEKKSEKGHQHQAQDL